MNRKWMAILAAACVLGAAFLFLQDTKKPEIDNQSDPGIVAKVGSREIRVEDFQRELVRRGGARPENVDPQKLLEEMIEDEVLMAKAVESGLDENPEIVRAYRNMVVAAFKKRELVPRIEKETVTDAEIKAYYDANPGEFTRLAKIRLAFLYMAIPSKVQDHSRIEKARAKMEEAREKALALKEERGFGSLAVEYSEDQATRYKGGDIGWVEEGRPYRWDPAVLAAGFDLENVGDVSEIVTTGDGIYLVKLMDRRPSRLVAFEKAAPRIRHKLTMEKEREVEMNFHQEMRAATVIEIYPEILESIATPSGPAAKGPVPPKL